MHSTSICINNKLSDGVVCVLLRPLNGAPTILLVQEISWPSHQSTLHHEKKTPLSCSLRLVSPIIWQDRQPNILLFRNGKLSCIFGRSQYRMKLTLQFTFSIWPPYEVWTMASWIQSPALYQNKLSRLLAQQIQPSYLLMCWEFTSPFLTCSWVTKDIQKNI